MSVKSEIWDIKSLQIVRDRVYFTEPLTREEAIKAFLAGDSDLVEDIMDTEYISTEEVIDAV